MYGLSPTKKELILIMLLVIKKKGVSERGKRGVLQACIGVNLPWMIKQKKTFHGWEQILKMVKPRE